MGRLWYLTPAMSAQAVLQCAQAQRRLTALTSAACSCQGMQVTCIAKHKAASCRALLQDAHVLALDEATANVDQATDALIQQALRDAVKNSDGGSPRRTLLVRDPAEHLAAQCYLVHVCAESQSSRGITILS